MVSRHVSRVSAPRDDDGVAGWRCSCGVEGEVNDYDAEYVALRQAREHVDNALSQWMLVYTVPDARHGWIHRSEGPYSEDVAMARRAEIWDSPLWADMDGGATVEMLGTGDK